MEQITPTKKLASGTVLLLADDPVFRRVTKNYLEDAGHSVEVAESYDAALNTLGLQQVDVVVIHSLAQQTTQEIDFIRQLRQTKRSENIPIVIVASQDAAEQVIPYFTHGVDDYILKTTKRDLLVARINNLIVRKRMQDRLQFNLSRLTDEKKLVDELLRSTFPAVIAEELKAVGVVRPRRYEPVAILVCDIVDFTPFCDANPPEVVVEALQKLMAKFQELAEQHNVLKIKTIGDAFMATANLLTHASNPVLNCVRFGIDAIEAASNMSPSWNLRVGIHLGPVVAGIISNQSGFDLWGDSVNVAFRLESIGADGFVNLSAAAWEAVSHIYDGKSQGMIEIKGKGEMEIFRITGLKQQSGF